MSKLAPLCLALSLLFTGCGGGEGTGETAPANQETPPTHDLSAVKSTLNDIAQSGEINSAFYGIPESLKEAGKPELAEEAEKLGSLKSPSQIKSAAKKLADKL
ncbi:MAG: hypothetical protein ACIAZJ_16600 [Gimesia chilikensis]|uniref:hypothetical protein n=1 Tax=Gimesia chilikensis TaxID=2605989 RepID=UPI0037950B93